MAWQRMVKSAGMRVLFSLGNSCSNTPAGAQSGLCGRQTFGSGAFLQTGVSAVSAQENAPPILRAECAVSA